MKIIPKIISTIISVGESIMQEGTNSMDETTQSLKSQCNELVEANEQLCQELEGNVKACFQGASSATSAKVSSAYSTLSALSGQIKEYTKQMIGVNEEAAQQGGGGEDGNEQLSV